MQLLPTAIGNLWSTLVDYPYTIISTVLFAILLHRMANRFNCYGLPRNLLFGVIGGAIAFVLIQLYAFLSRSYGLHSLVIAEFIAGYETAVVFTVIRRLVFAQRPPQTSLPYEDNVE